MKRSSDRILTTHLGSRARPPALLLIMRENGNGRSYDHASFTRQVREAVAECGRRQVEAGIDILTDGEQGKVAFLNYVKDRLTGFEAAVDEPVMPESWKKEVADFPDSYHGYCNKYSAAVSPLRGWCVAARSNISASKILKPTSITCALQCRVSAWLKALCRRSARAVSAVMSTAPTMGITTQQSPRRCGWNISAPSRQASSCRSIVRG